LLRQGATENATVVGELLGDLMNRGLDFSQPRLYVLDGGKALSAAVKKYAGLLYTAFSFPKRYELTLGCLLG
jgi:acid phosphatase family membrane protein YuiD